MKRATTVAAGLLMSVAVQPMLTAYAGTTAHARIVDNYNHGKVRVYVDGVARTLAYGQGTAFFTITPDPQGNDGISVTSLRFSGCGVGEVGNYFNVGHKYRVVVYATTEYYCHRSDGSRVRGPGFRVVRVS